jgi:hypothetical protein
MRIIMLKLCCGYESRLLQFFPETIRVRKVLTFVLVGIFFASISIAQDKKLLKEYTRTDYFSGAKLSFVLLTDKTIDMFFSGPSKDVVQAKVNAGTCFYVLGTTEKNIKMSTDFVVEQDGEKFAGTIMNLKNFVDGDVAKGEKISGILQLQNKLNLAHQFSVKGAGGLVDFKLSNTALMNLPN